MNMILQLLAQFSEQEAIFRILVAMGSLLSARKDDFEKLVALIQTSETALQLLKDASDDKSNHSTQNKLVDCCRHIVDLIF